MSAINQNSSSIGTANNVPQQGLLGFNNGTQAEQNEAGQQAYNLEIQSKKKMNANAQKFEYGQTQNQQNYYNKGFNQYKQYTINNQYAYQQQQQQYLYYSMMQQQQNSLTQQQQAQFQYQQTPFDQQQKTSSYNAYQQPKQATKETQPSKKLLSIKDRMELKNKKMDNVNNFNANEQKQDNWGELNTIPQQEKAKPKLQKQEQQASSQVSTQPASNQKTVELTEQEKADIEQKKIQQEALKQKLYLQTAPEKMNNEWLLKFILKGTIEVELQNNENLMNFKNRKRFEVNTQRQQNNTGEFKIGRHWVVSTKEEQKEIVLGRDYNRQQIQNPQAQTTGDDWAILRNYDENYERKMEFTKKAQKNEVMNKWKEALPEDKQAIKDIRGVLNKLAEANFENLKTIIFKAIIKNKMVFTKAIETIIDKATSDKKFTYIYARLCASFKSNPALQKEDFQFGKIFRTKNGFL